jgi:hypothetical protein
MIEADLAERFASTFVPIWQFDDAPFCAGAPLSDEDIHALGGKSINNSSPVESLPPPSTVAENALAAAPRESAATVPVAGPSLSFEDSNVFRRPTNRLLLGGGAGGAAIFVILAVAFTRTEVSPQPSSIALTSRLTSAAESVDIPSPPPPLSDVTEATTAAVAAPPSSAALPQGRLDDADHQPARTQESGPLSGPLSRNPSQPRESVANPAPRPESSARPTAKERIPMPVSSPPQRGDRPPSKRSVDVDFGI